MQPPRMSAGRSEKDVFQPKWFMTNSYRKQRPRIGRGQASDSGECVAEPQGVGTKRRDPPRVPLVPGQTPAATQSDRKSTRLNSSHVAISYAVFCLKKKKTSIR